MLLVALETSELAGSVAAFDGSNLLLQIDLDPNTRSAQSLAPTLKTLWERVGRQPSEIDLVAVTVGPGSFTGLRVGVTTAKMLAYAAGAEVLGVSTLDVVAEQATPGIDRLCVAIDAQRGEVVVRDYERSADGVWQGVSEERLVEIDTWLADLPDGCAVSGPILRKIRDRVPERLRCVDAACWTPQAATVGRIAARLYAAGQRDDVWKLLPRYSRRAAAEEKWELRQKGE